MAGTALQRRLTWRIAQVVELVPETRRVRTVILDCPGWEGHLPGQHVDIRLRAPDGYEAQRSYSLAAPADGERLAITVELVDGGEVSSFLVEDLLVGDAIELRGPIGGYFTWAPGDGEPVQLIAGGSGVVPLMAMLRARVAAGTTERMRLLLSARSYDDIIYRAELDELAGLAGIRVTRTLTRSSPPGWEGLTGRIDRDMLERLASPASERPLVYVCGPTGFVEAVASSMVELGHAAGNVRTERFGPSGGSP